jgi:serine protease AprX
MIESSPSRSMRPRVAAVLVLCALAAGCAAPRRIVARQPGEDEFDRITLSSLDSVQAMPRSVVQLPDAAYTWRNPAARPQPLPRASARPARMDSTLEAWVADSSATKIDTLLVSFASKVKVPRFPNPDISQPRSSPANVALLDSAQVLIAMVAAARDSQYDADSLALESAYGAQVLERYWITQALRVIMPLGRVDTLSIREDVIYIQRDHTGVPPPYSPDSNDDNDPAFVRGKMVSDRLRDAGFPPGWISVLDTGVRSTHELFGGTTAPFNRLGDCVDGGIDCADGTSTDDITEGHGTASAAILVGTGGKVDPSGAEPAYDFERFRGVTAGTLDAFRVYREHATNPDGEFVGSAGLRGLQSATALLDRVIVAEIQDYTSSEAAALCDAADQAFAAGAVVVAANGTFGSTALGVPAVARRVLGIGALHLLTGSRLTSQSYGRTLDGRTKPDLQAYTSTETAGAEADDDTYFLSGTSGSVPYAGGAAALIRGWMEYWRGGPVDPGQVMAHMILAGQRESPYEPTSKDGAGEIVLPSNGWAYFSKAELSEAYPEVDIPLTIHWPDIARAEVALWWPETLIIDEGMVTLTHNDIDFHLLDDAGTDVARGVSGGSVFEHASAPVVTSSGTWTLRIKAKTPMGLSPQTVYWTVAMRR